MKATIITAGLFSVALATTALAQGAVPNAETQSGSSNSAQAVTPSTSANSSASTQMGASADSQQANVAAANSVDPKSQHQASGMTNEMASASGSVTPNGPVTANPAGSGASNSATLNEHGETGSKPAAQ